MYWKLAALAGLLSLGKAQEADCPDGTELIEYQSIDVIIRNPGGPDITSKTTLTRTTTIPPTDGLGYVTLTSTGTNTVPTTYTLPPGEGGGPGTVVIEEPPGYVTVTTTGSVATTYTLPPGEGGGPGTIIYQEPPTFVSITRTGTGSVPITRTLPPGSPGDPITVIIETPPSRYVTLTSTGTGSVPTTRTVPPGEDGSPGTVVVENPPPPYITTTEPYDGPTPITGPITSTRPPSGTNPGVVVIQTPPPPYLTITEPYDGPSPITGPITSTRPPSGTSPGVVVIQTPPSVPPAVTTTVTTGSVPTTYTVTGTGTAPDTVVIQDPPTAVSSAPTSTSNEPTPTTSAEPSSSTSEPSSSSSEAASSSATPSPSCVPVPGFNYSLYDNPYVRGDGPGSASTQDDPYDNFDPSVFLKPDALLAAGPYDGEYNLRLEDVSTAKTIYDTPDVDVKQKVLMSQAYIYSSVAQEVAICLQSNWDIDFWWVNDAALSGYTRANANDWHRGGGQSSGGFRPCEYPPFQVEADSYTPVRLLTGWGSNTERMNVAAVDLVLQADTPVELVAVPCPEANATPFPDA